MTRFVINSMTTMSACVSYHTAIIDLNLRNGSISKHDTACQNCHNRGNTKSVKKLNTTKSGQFEFLQLAIDSTLADTQGFSNFLTITAVVV